jgi:PAS domain S-box-containing protein
LLPPLSAALILIVAGSATLLWHQHAIQLREKTAVAHADIVDDVHDALEQQASSIAAMAQPIVADPDVRQALRKGDSGSLLRKWRPIFEAMRWKDNLTHFNFIAADRILLLRVHQPDRRGDLINRFTALEAERTGKTAWGLESGLVGGFTLRVVQPVLEGGDLLGYVELGKELDEVLRALHKRAGSQFAMVLGKESLDRQTWDAGMRMLGRETEWDRLPHSVIIYASEGRLPNAFAQMADYDPGAGRAHGEMDREIVFDGKNWSVSAAPLQNVSGKEVGRLLVMTDITVEKTVFHRMTALGIMCGAILLAALLGLVFVLLRRTDSSIRAQQASLLESEERFDQLAEQSRTFIWEVDADGLCTYVSHVAEQVLGYQQDELVGRSHFQDLHPGDGSEAFKTEALAVFERKEPFKDLVNLTRTKDGRPIWLSTNDIALLNVDGTLRGYRGSDTDITERKQAEQIIYAASHDLRSPLVNVAGYGREIEYSVGEMRKALENSDNGTGRIEKVLRSELPDINDPLRHIRRREADGRTFQGPSEAVTSWSRRAGHRSTRHE